MSRICKLAIKGIRNFDDEADPPTIKFARPLTLILGPNGTGKTTIIECLRYALSGEFPPGSDNGKAFIHDAMLKKLPTVQVRGNVKLEIAGSRGEHLIIGRTIQSTKNRDKLIFKTLDSTITNVDRNTREKTAHPSKCIDVNVEMMSAMGISKAILNYVIFCHQDDSNWPFETGKKLKERFDEIFETTRYNKALDCIRKLMNDKKIELRAFVAEQQALTIVVDEVKSKERKLVEFQSRKEETEKKIQDLTSKLKPINDRLARIKELEIEYCKWQIEDEKKKIEYQLATQQIVSLKGNIKALYTGSTTKLANEIASYDKILSAKNNEISQLEGELEESCAKEMKISNQIAERRVTVGTLRQRMRDQTARIAKRNDILRDTIAAWDSDESIGFDLTETDFDKLIKSFADRLHRLEEQVEAKRVEQDREQDRLQRNINILRAERSTTESQLEHNESELVKIRAEMRTSQALLKQSGATEEQLNEVDLKLDEANRRVDQLNKMFNIDAHKRKIDEAIAEEEDFESKYNRLDEEITQLRKKSSMHANLERCQKELMFKEMEFQALKEKHGDNLRMLLGIKDFSVSNMTTKMNEVHQVLNKRVQNLRKEIETVQYEVTKLETSVTHKKRELETKENQIRSDKDRLSLHCKDYTNFREILLLHSTKIKDLQDKRGVCAYQRDTNEEHIKKLTEPDPCCPLCHRGFNSSKYTTELVTELRNKTSGHPDRLKKYDRDLAAQQKKYDELLQLQPIVDKIENFERSEIRKSRQDIEELKKSLQSSRQKLIHLQDSMAEPERKLSVCTDMMADMGLWDCYYGEVNTYNMYVVEMEDELQVVGSQTDKTMQQAHKELNELQQKMKKARNDIKTLQSMLNSGNEELRRATDSRTKLLEEQLRIHKEMQDIKQAKEKLQVLRSKEITVAETIRKLQERLTNVNNQLEIATKNLEGVKRDFNIKQESDRKVVRERAKELDKLNSIQSEVNEAFTENIEEKLKVVEEQLESAEKMAAKFKIERTAREGKVSKMKENILFHDTAKRDLVDNLTLRDKETQVETLKIARQELKDRLTTTDYATVMKDRNELCEHRDATERERNKAQGNDEELVKNVADLTLELKKKEYRLARENYKNKCAELSICRQSVDDLHMYSKVLDAAMIAYHEERMNTVNKTMKKLWDLIYTGTDTTSIQIRTEATTANADKRRQFNYKLIQIKHGTEMDMKGRCSAGQKVLASIILRLALAETFCEKCGVLALDEPTTNLDEENAKSLADALHKYVKLRMSQRNFQLIVITHDENFISQLGQLSTKNSYYELFRHSNGLSGIRSVPLDGLLSRKSEQESESEDERKLTVRSKSKRAHVPSVEKSEPSGKRHRGKYDFQ